MSVAPFSMLAKCIVSTWLPLLAIIMAIAKCRIMYSATIGSYCVMSCLHRERNSRETTGLPYS